MSEKDSLSNQDIPAVIRALGTLALVAATALAIKWFLLRDSKVEKPEDNEADFQNNQDSLDDGRSPRNDSKEPDEVPGKNANMSQVSDGVEIKLTLLPYDCQLPGLSRGSLDTPCISQNNGDAQENGKQRTINVSGDISLDKRQFGDLTPISYKLNNVDSPQCTLFTPRRSEVEMPALPAAFVDIKANDTQNQVSCSCLIHGCDNPSCERSENAQELESSSGNGECIDYMNVESLGCQHKLSGHDNIAPGRFLQQTTVSMSLPGDIFKMDTYEKDGVLTFDSKLNMVNHTKYSVENKFNAWRSVRRKSVHDNTRIPVSEREGHEICITHPSESDGSIVTNTRMPIYSHFSDGVAIKSDSTTQLTVNPKFTMKNDLQYADGLSDVKKTTTTVFNESEHVILTNECCNNISQHETFHYKQDTHITYTRQSDMGQDIPLNDGKIKEEANEQLNSSNTSSKPYSVHLVEEHMTDKDNNDTENMMFFSSGKVLHDSHNEKYKEESTPVDVQISSSSELMHSPKCFAYKCMDGSKINNTFCYNNNNSNSVLQWSTTTVYNSTEYIDLMYPLDLHAPKKSIHFLGEKNECQHYAKDDALVSRDKNMSKDLFANISFERTYKDFDADVESSVVRPTLFNTAYYETKHPTRANNNLENILCDPSTVDRFNSKMVTRTEFISSIKSTNNKQNNKEFQIMSTKECCSVFTKGYLGINQKHPNANSVGSSSEKYKKLEDHCGKDYGPSTLSTLPIEEFASWGNPHFCNDNTTYYLSPAMIDTHQTEQKSQQASAAINKETNIFKESVSAGKVEQTFDTVDSLLHPIENAEQSNLDNMYLCSNTTCFEQDQQHYFTCCNSNLSGKQEQDKSLPFNNIKIMCTAKADDHSISREKIMSTIAENPQLILPEYQSVFIPKMKMPLMTKSCDNIQSGLSCQGPTLKNKAQSMLCLLTEYYSSKLHSFENGPVEEVARGSFICVPKGLQNIGDAMRFQLTLGNCLELLKVARKRSVPELLKAVYTVISDNYLNVLKNSAIYGHLTGLERERILQLRMRGRLSLCIVETKSIFDLNKNIRCSVETDQAQCKDQLYSLDMETNQWQRVTRIPEEACLKGCSICSMHNYLFIAGGIQKTNDGSVCSNKLFCYNPLTDIWTQLTPMNQARSQLKLIPLDGYLYAIGGECLHTVERYDLRLNKWTFTAPLPKGFFAVAHESAACGGEIYISGGHLFYRLLKYNPSRDQWEECPFNASKSRSCDMVAVGSILYRFDMYKDSTVNIFKYNTTAKMWSEYTTTFPGSKVPFRCAVLDDTIYCLNRETTARFSVENGKALFESPIFSPAPTRGVGYPCPVVLCLLGSISQTSV